MKNSRNRSTVGQGIVTILERLGVRTVFGLPGLQNIELFDALADAAFPTFTPADERAVVFMADAHARVSGVMGVAVLTAGPGLTNALTAIAEARLDSSPVLILLSACGGVEGKSFQLHQIPQRDIVSPLVKGFFKPVAPGETVSQVLEAARLATEGEPGPVIVELAPNLLLEEVRFDHFPTEDRRRLPGIDDHLDQAADCIRNSPRIGVYAGAGAFGAHEEIRELSELLCAPVATTISGRGILSEDHPLSVGYGFSRSGTPVARRLFSGIDALVAVGCKYGETATGSYGVRPPRKHIHIDTSVDSIGANYPVSVAIHSDAQEALRGLLKRLESDRRPRDSVLIRTIREARESRRCRADTSPALETGVHPAVFFHRLRQCLDRDAILVTDTGAHQLWALSDFEVFCPRSFITPADFQTMGFPSRRRLPPNFVSPTARSSQSSATAGS